MNDNQQFQSAPLPQQPQYQQQPEQDIFAQRLAEHNAALQAHNTIFCKDCGNPVDRNASVCIHCGYVLNKESFAKTLESGYTWFWSRSRQELWNKGATSGHLQKVVEIFSDCDDDTILITVEQTGAACHTGNHSCFYTQIK